MKKSLYKTFLDEQLLRLSAYDQFGREERQEILTELFDIDIGVEQFYNFFNAEADFSHWSKAPYWTLDEAVALSFGKEPAVVNWAILQIRASASLFAFAYSRILDLAHRAKASKQLDDPELPGSYLAWAQRTGIPVPEELVKMVESSGIVVGDWKSKYDELKAQHDNLLDKMNALTEACDRLTVERDACKEQVAKLEASPWRGFNKESPFYPLELDVAMQAWVAVSGNRDTSMTVKEQVKDWLEPRFKVLSREALERAMTVCNWEKRGGRRKR
jgi:hypothetical protein